MVVCKLLLYVWMGYLIGTGIGEQRSLARAVKQSSLIKQGASKDEVLDLLGEPLFRWKARKAFLFGSHPPQWVYGTNVDLEFTVIPEMGVLNPLPVRLRLFSADEDDLVIDWDKKGQVAKIQRPDIELVEGLDELYEPLEFINMLGRAVMDQIEATADQVDSRSQEP